MPQADRDAARRRLHRLAPQAPDRPTPGGHPWELRTPEADGAPDDGPADRPGGATDGCDGPVDRPGGVTDGSSGGGEPPAGGWVPDGALRAAASQYSWQYPADDGHDDDPPPGGVRPAAAGRPHARWAIPWRVAGTAALVVALVAGAAVLRSVALTPGAAVELPEPVPAGAAGAASPGATSGAGTGKELGTELGTEPGTADGGSGTPSAGVVVVHVVGAVKAPGVVRLPTGSRVEDAVAAAGGAAPDADLARVNLARVLVDGEQVVVPHPGEAVPVDAGGVTSGVGGDAPVDLNSASLAQLDALPGVGPVLAQRIADRRPYSTVDELDEVSGIGPTLLERLRPLVRV